MQLYSSGESWPVSIHLLHGRLPLVAQNPTLPIFFGPGQVYVKILPDGDPVQLTHDDLMKMSPTFSPDGSRIAYTVVGADLRWDSWVVPVLGGEPQPWLRNASGLTWTGPRQILFSKKKMGIHMGVVTAEESRVAERAVYFPEDEIAMAHRSYLSQNKCVLAALAIKT